MSFLGWPEVRVNSEVDLDAFGLEPRPAPSGEMMRLGHFFQAEEVDIEAPGGVFPPRGHGELDVVDPYDSQVASMLLAEGPGRVPARDRARPRDYHASGAGVAEKKMFRRVQRVDVRPSCAARP